MTACTKCEWELQKRVKGWPRIGAAGDQPAIQPATICKLLGRLGLGPEHPRISELRRSWERFSELEGELAAVEGDAPERSPLLADRFAGLNPDSPIEIRIEAVRDEICEEIAAAVLPLARIMPFTFRATLTRGRVAEILRREVEELRRAADDKQAPDPVRKQARERWENLSAALNILLPGRIASVSTKETAEEQRLETLRIELMEEDDLERFRRDCVSQLEEAYNSPTAEIEPWAVSADDWRKAFLMLAINRREAGFILDEIDGRQTDLTENANLIGDDPAHYGDLMLPLLKALGGDEFDPAARLPDGHLTLAVKAAKKNLDAQRNADIWEPARGDGADEGTLKTVPSQRRADWAAGRRCEGEFSKRFARRLQRAEWIQDVFEIAEQMSAEPR
jgi:hypothetical protein